MSVIREVGELFVKHSPQKINQTLLSIGIRRYISVESIAEHLTTDSVINTTELSGSVI